jgi:hypothetical protein
VGPHVARASIEHHARDAEELGEVLADDLRADGLSGGLAQLEQALELAVLDLCCSRRCTFSRRRALSYARRSLSAFTSTR